MNMNRVTEQYGKQYFRVRGNKTVYNRNPEKSSRVACALAKLFEYESTGMEPEEIVDGKILDSANWIPVVERIPEENGQYLVTVREDDPLLPMVFLDIASWEEDTGWDTERIVAWRPCRLPEPYKSA